MNPWRAIPAFAFGVIILAGLYLVFITQDLPILHQFALTLFAILVGLLLAGYIAGYCQMRYYLRDLELKGDRPFAEGDL